MKVKSWIWVDALSAGATAGLLAEVLVLRTNPEVTQSLRGVLVGLPLWASWGMLCLGAPLVVALALLERIRPRPERWAGPALFAAVFVVAGILSRTNARLHAHSLEETIRRILDQDAVAWAVAALLTLGGGAFVRRLGAGRRLRSVFAIVVLALPVARMLWATTPPRYPLRVDPYPLGEPARPLLVIGVEGLDTKVLMADAAIGSCPTIERLREESSWGPLTPHRPHLRWALWTSVATGTFPGRHGVKAHWGWNLSLVFPETLRLLPWTPEGSRMILPWGLAERVLPPPATVAPLWARLKASEMTTEVFGWPGAWTDDSVRTMDPGEGGSTSLEGAMGTSLEAALEPFPKRRAEIWGAIVRDQRRVEAAIRALRAGTEDVWIHLESLSLTRRFHEPWRPRDTHERRFLEVTIELLDEQVGSLLNATRRNALVVVVSPYGLAPPNSVERLRRLVGGGGTWRASAETGPNGLLMLFGDDVPPGRRLPAANPPDVAPTVCYLLGLPVAQYMEGGVIVDAVAPEFLAENPLRVVD